MVRGDQLAASLMADDARPAPATGGSGLTIEAIVAVDSPREFRMHPRDRVVAFTAEAAGLYLDYAKNRVTEETLRLLVQLAEECGLRERIEAMFRGEKLNVTENRAALHIALRAPRGTSILVDGRDVVPEVHAVLDRMADFAARVRGGA